MKKSHRHDDGGSLPDLLLADDKVHAREVRRVVMTGCAVNALLMIMKLVVGWYGRSDALIADGFHSLNDVAVDLVMLIFVGISYRKASASFAYGYGKFETFSSVLIACMMLFIATMIGIAGVKAIIGYAHGEVLEHPDIWTLVAVVAAMVAKESLYRYYTSAGRRLDSNALRGAGWHHRVDALSSVAVLADVAGAHFLGEKWRVLDPAVSLVIAVLIVVPALRLLVPSFRELMDVQLPESERKRAGEAVAKVEGVLGVVSLKARRAGHSRIFDIVIRVAPHTTVEEGAVIAGRIEEMLRREFCPHIYVTVGTRA